VSRRGNGRAADDKSRSLRDDKTKRIALSFRRDLLFFVGAMRFWKSPASAGKWGLKHLLLADVPGSLGYFGDDPM
jgi:hypothetical protein